LDAPQASSTYYSKSMAMDTFQHYFLLEVRAVIVFMAKHVVVTSPPLKGTISHNQNHYGVSLPK
jgi:hypothetical protein